jgi:tRNA-specific 2-thiouridylase
MGRHQGVIHYTIGQRKGLGIGGQKEGDNEPLYVIRLDAARRQVVVGTRQDLRCQQMRLTEVNWLGDAAPNSAAPVTNLAVAVKWRSMMTPVPARLSLITQPAGDIQAIVTLDSADDHGAIARDKPVCFIRGNGCWAVDQYRGQALMTLS